MKKRNILLSTAAALTMAAMMTVGVSATGWQKNNTGWWYGTNDANTTWHANGWQWIDGNGDGTAECYYFDQNGYMLSATTTPDGYTVNSDGAWTANGVVQTKQMAVNTNAVTTQNTNTSSSSSSAANNTITWPVTASWDWRAENSVYNYLQNKDFVSLVESQFVFDNGGYNEYGISNAAIDLLTHSREENKKYGELFVVEEAPLYGSCMTITYKNGMTMTYLHSNDSLRQYSTARVDMCTWWPSVEGKETYLFKYATSTKSSGKSYSETRRAMKQKLWDLGFDDSKVSWTCLLTGQDVVFDDTTLEVAADYISGEVFGATKM